MARDRLVQRVRDREAMMAPVAEPRRLGYDRAAQDTLLADVERPAMWRRKKKRANSAASTLLGD